LLPHGVALQPDMRRQRRTTVRGQRRAHGESGLKAPGGMWPGAT
jgi:hypothetical protein